MPLTFAQLRTEVLQWLDESRASVTSSSYLNVEAALKQAHTLRMTEDNWKHMLYPAVQALTTAANIQTYPLHQEFLRPFYFRNVTRKVWMVETPARNIEPGGVSFEDDVDTQRFCLWGRSPVLYQPSSASVITIVSSSAADTEVTKAITIHGDTADGVRSEAITPTGTTPAVGSVSFTHILGVSKGLEWAGTMTMTSNSGALTNLKLFPTEFGRTYPQMQLLYLPTAGESIYYRFYRKPRELENDGDITDVPPPFERILVYDALLLMGAYDNRLDQGRMALWTRMRDDLDTQMRHALLEGQSLGAEGRFIQERMGSVQMRLPD